MHRRRRVSGWVGCAPGRTPGDWPLPNRCFSSSALLLCCTHVGITEQFRWLVPHAFCTCTRLLLYCPFTISALPGHVCKELRSTKSKPVRDTLPQARLWTVSVLPHRKNTANCKIEPMRDCRLVPPTYSGRPGSLGTLTEVHALGDLVRRVTGLASSTAHQRHKLRLAATTR